MAGVGIDTYGDGINQWSLISTGTPAKHQRTKFVYNLDLPLSAIRHHDFKLVYEANNLFLHGSGRSKLYQISKDSYESRDISRRHPKLVRELVRKIHEYQKSSRAPVRTAIDEAGNPRRFRGVYASGWCK